MKPTNRSAARHGLTLVELVIVVFIMTLLMAIAVPQFRAGIEERRTREAARALSVALGAARNQAMATGRPVGGVLRRFTDGQMPNAATVIEQTESMAPYAGETTSSSALVYFQSSILTAQLSNVDLSKIQANDRIQFNHQGHWYRIINAGSNPIQLAYDSTLQYPWPASAAQAQPVPFLVQRQARALTGDPILGSASTPIQLPDRAAIDLSASGFGNSAEFTGGTAPAVIMFAPSGRVGYVATGNSNTWDGVSPIYLLAGERSRISGNVLEDDGIANIETFKSLWVAVQPRTGLATVAEMAAEGAAPIADKRAFAREAQSMGGR